MNDFLHSIISDISKTSKQHEKCNSFSFVLRIPLKNIDVPEGGVFPHVCALLIWVMVMNIHDGFLEIEDRQVHIFKEWQAYFVKDWQAHIFKDLQAHF